MVESHAELEARGVFGAIGDTGEPHASAPLGQLVTTLFDELGNLQDASCVVELCSRDFELSRYLPLQGLRYYGMDLNEPSSEPFMEDVPGEAPRSSEHGIPKESFVPIRGDLFEPKTLKALPDEGGPRFVYCRPPAQKALSQLSDSVEAAKALVVPYLAERAERLCEKCPEIELSSCSELSLYEWYFVFAAAKLIDGRPGSAAVIQVPTRVLNLARAADGRRLLLEYGLLGSVILLPSGIAPDSEDAALLCLTDGEPNRPVFAYDARGFGSAPLGTSDVERLVADMREARERNEATCWIRPLENDRATCSLMPHGKEGAFDPSLYKAFGKVAAVNRGVSRSAITKLPEARAEDEYAPQDHYYLSLKPLVDGSIASANDIASPEVISSADIYDLGWVATDDLSGIRCLDTRKTNLLITRVGPPFKLALVTPGHTCLGPDGETVDGLIDCGIVPSDSLFYIEFEDELLATFLLAYLSSQEGQYGLAQIAHGTTLRQISPKDLRAMRVPVPPREEQERYAQAYREKQSAYERALEASERHANSKRTLM